MQGLGEWVVELESSRDLVGTTLADEASDGWGEGGDEIERVAHELNVCSCWPMVGVAGVHRGVDDRDEDCGAGAESRRHCKL